MAGRNAAGATDEYRSVPTFWSEQYDLYIQGAGTPPPKPGRDVPRAGPGQSRITFTLAGEHIAYALGVNAQRDMAIVRRLIERQTAVAPAALADPAASLADFLKAKPISAAIR